MLFRSQGAGETRQIGIQLREWCRLLIHPVSDVAGIKQQASKTEVRTVADGARQRDGFFGRRDADAMHPQIGLNVDVEGPTSELGGDGQRGQRRRVVSGDPDAHVVRQTGQSFQSRRAHGRIGNEKVVAHFTHDLGFAQRRAGQANRAVPKLLRGDPRGLVRLDVRTQLETVKGGICRHPVQIQRHPVEVNDRHRRFELFQERRHAASAMDLQCEQSRMSASARDWTPITLPDVPPPAGSYSPGVRAGNPIFVSAHTPPDPATGPILGDPSDSQPRVTFANLARIVHLPPPTMAQLVSVTVYLADEDDWGRFNEVYKSVMSPPYPTRAVVGAQLRGILVEISAVAYIP